MTADSRSSRDDSPERNVRSFRRLLLAGATTALAGAVLSIAISYLHARLDSSGGSYTSFCNVSSEVNCDRVLTSSFAKLAGVPIAWLALITYAGIALAYLRAAKADGVAARRALQVACIASIGAAAFAVYMAAVSLWVLGTICLLCSGLYLVSAVLLAIALAAPRRSNAIHAGLPPLFARGVLTAVITVSLVGVAALAGATWPSNGAIQQSTVSLAELRANNPEFFDWYTELPVVTPPSLRDGLEPDARVPVTIVEFFDFQCGHCRRSHALTTALEARRPRQVQVVRRHFPLDPSCNEAVPEALHPQACRAAEAAECARLQGRFDDMSDALFREQSRLFNANLIYQAKKLGMDVDAFQRCLESHETLPRVIADCRAGNKLGLTSTPTLLINGRLVRGTFDDATSYDIAVLIEAEAAAGRSVAGAQ